MSTGEFNNPESFRVFWCWAALDIYRVATEFPCCLTLHWTRKGNSVLWWKLESLEHILLHFLISRNIQFSGDHNFSTQQQKISSNLKSHINNFPYVISWTESWKSPENKFPLPSEFITSRFPFSCYDHRSGAINVQCSICVVCILSKCFLRKLSSSPIDIPTIPPKMSVSHKSLTFFCSSSMFVLTFSSWIREN